MNDNSIYRRRSIRKFLDKPVSKDSIDKIIDAGRVAPSAKNRQPWKYIVFGGDKKGELLDYMEKGIIREEMHPALPNSRKGITDAKNTLRIMREAPVIIIILNTNGKSIFDNVDPDERVTEICDSLSIGASVQNILLKATEAGLGTLWIANTCFAYDELSNYLNIECQLVGAIAVGYANEEPLERPRYDLKDILEYRL